jgi:vacuolar-type H+-ATPase subunit H
MNGPIEEALKALAEFEAELDKAKVEAADSRREMIKNATDWAESAKGKAVTEAKIMAADTVSQARKEAESQAGKIKNEGEKTLKGFENTLSRNMDDATELVIRLLTGETS